MTILGLYIFMMMMLIGGLALDVSNAIQARTQLQIAADAAGHSALFWKRFHPNDDPKGKAIEIAEGNMPTSYYGSVLAEDDIVFGTWDADTRTFTPDATSKTAVWVSTRRLAENSNALSTYLLRIIGLTAFDINTDSVWELYVPGCMLEGFVADGLISIQSDNDYRNGFCIHTNTGVDFSNHNRFESEVVVSMPNPSTQTRADFATNPGLEDALRDYSYELDLDYRFTEFLSDIQDPNSDIYPDYLLSHVPVDVDYKDDLDPAIIVPGYIYNVDCPGPNTKINVPSSAVLSEVVIITNCIVGLGSDARLEDAVLVTTNDSASSVKGASGVVFGKDDNCADGGSTTIMTRGSMDFPSQMSLYGSQLVALGDVSFSSHGDGLEGASIVAGGEIDATSHMDMAFCGNGAGLFNIDKFRMVL